MGDHPPPAPPLSIILDDKNVRLRWAATNSAGFALFSGTDLLQTSSWLPRGGSYILNGGLYEYREPMLLSSPSTFSRRIEHQSY